MKYKIAALLDGWNIRHGIERDEFVLERSKLRICIPSINEDLAYLLGFLCGDGCLAKPQPRKKGGVRFKIIICFSGSEKGRAQARHICDIFERYFYYVPRVRHRKRKLRKDWLEVEINSAVIYAYFCRLGLPIGRKYGKLRVPSVVHTEALFKKFLRGLIDSDGYIRKDQSCDSTKRYEFSRSGGEAKLEVFKRQILDSSTKQQESGKQNLHMVLYPNF